RQIFTHPASHRDGFIVVAVLWMLSALAALASVYSVYVANTVMAVAVNDDALETEAFVSASLELAAYQLTTTPSEERPTRGRFAYRMGRAGIAVEFCSEAARIDLNLASKELLAGLFAALGATSGDAAQYADRIIGWRTRPAAGSPDAEESFYRAAGLNYGPRGAPFAHVGELSLVVGLPPALVERALPFVTVYSGRAEVNVLDAAPEVIAALPGMTPERLNLVLAERPALNRRSQMTIFGEARNVATTEGSKATRVTVRIRFDNGRRTAAGAVILIDDGDEPFRILSWQNEMDARPPMPDVGLVRSGGA